MSNHSGSYMLNEVLKKLDKKSVFALLGKEKTQALVQEIINISHAYDCNSGEILEDMAERVGVCSYCLESADEFNNVFASGATRNEWFNYLCPVVRRLLLGADSHPTTGLGRVTAPHVPGACLGWGGRGF